MPNDTNDKYASDLEREFEQELKKEKRPEESLLPEEEEFEKEYVEEMQEQLPPKKELDPYAEKFYALTTKKFKTEAELSNAVSKILSEIEHDFFFKGLVQKTSKSGKLLLQKGLKTFKGVPAFQAATAITQMVRDNLKVTLGTLAKTALRGMQAETTSPTLKALGFEAGERFRWHLASGPDGLRSRRRNRAKQGSLAKLHKRMQRSIRLSCKDPQ